MKFSSFKMPLVLGTACCVSLDTLLGTCILLEHRRCDWFIIVHAVALNARLRCQNLYAARTCTRSSRLRKLLQRQECSVPSWEVAIMRPTNGMGARTQDLRKQRASLIRQLRQSPRVFGA